MAKDSASRNEQKPQQYIQQYTHQQLLREPPSIVLTVPEAPFLDIHIEDCGYMSRQLTTELLHTTISTWSIHDSEHYEKFSGLWRWDTIDKVWTARDTEAGTWFTVFSSGKVLHETPTGVRDDYTPEQRPEEWSKYIPNDKLGPIPRQTSSMPVLHDALELLPQYSDFVKEMRRKHAIRSATELEARKREETRAEAKAREEVQTRPSGSQPYSFRMPNLGEGSGEGSAYVPTGSSTSIPRDRSAAPAFELSRMQESLPPVKVSVPKNRGSDQVTMKGASAPSSTTVKPPKQANATPNAPPKGTFEAIWGSSPSLPQQASASRNTATDTSTKSKSGKQKDRTRATEYEPRSGHAATGSNNVEKFTQVTRNNGNSRANNARPQNTPANAVKQAQDRKAAVAQHRAAENAAEKAQATIREQPKQVPRPPATPAAPEKFERKLCDYSDTPQYPGRTFTEQELSTGTSDIPIWGHVTGTLLLPTEKDPQKRLDYHEKNENNAVCAHCKAHGLICDHDAPCGSCKQNGVECRYEQCSRSASKCWKRKCQLLHEPTQLAWGKSFREAFQVNGRAFMIVWLKRHVWELDPAFYHTFALGPPVFAQHQHANPEFTSSSLPPKNSALKMPQGYYVRSIHDKHAFSWQGQPPMWLKVFKGFAAFMREADREADFVVEKAKFQEQQSKASAQDSVNAITKLLNRQKAINADHGGMTTSLGDGEQSEGGPEGESEGEAESESEGESEDASEDESSDEEPSTLPEVKFSSGLLNPERPGVHRDSPGLDLVNQLWGT